MPVCLVKALDQQVDHLMVLCAVERQGDRVCCLAEPRHCGQAANGQRQTGSPSQKGGATR
jgi:hypothetical protein